MMTRDSWSLAIQRAPELMQSLNSSLHNPHESVTGYGLFLKRGHYLEKFLGKFLVRDSNVSSQQSRLLWR